MIQVIVRDVWDHRRGRLKDEPTVGEDREPALVRAALKDVPRRRAGLRLVRPRRREARRRCAEPGDSALPARPACPSGRARSRSRRPGRRCRAPATRAVTTTTADQTSENCTCEYAVWIIEPMPSPVASHSASSAPVMRAGHRDADRGEERRQGRREGDLAQRRPRVAAVDGDDVAHLRARPSAARRRWSPARGRAPRCRRSTATVATSRPKIRMISGRHRDQRHRAQQHRDRHERRARRPWTAGTTIGAEQRGRERRRRSR